MKQRSFLQGRRALESKDTIIILFKSFDKTVESADKTDAMLIFATSKQHTQLDTSSKKIYCVLDGARQVHPLKQ